MAATAARNNASQKARTIARAAAEVGVGVETIRYYERLGLIRQPRASGGFRVYPEATVERMRWIGNAKRMGFRLEEIRELLALAEDDHSCGEICNRIEAKVAELDAQIEQLAARRDRMKSLLAQSPRGESLAECPVYGALKAN